MHECVRRQKPTLAGDADGKPHVGVQEQSCRSCGNIPASPSRPLGLPARIGRPGGRRDGRHPAGCATSRRANRLVHELADQPRAQRLATSAVPHDDPLLQQVRRLLLAVQLQPARVRAGRQALADRRALLPGREVLRHRRRLGGADPPDRHTGQGQVHGPQPRTPVPSATGSTSRTT